MPIRVLHWLSWLHALPSNELDLRYRYEIVVYKPGSESEELCLMNRNIDVVQGNYKNVNYLVSRVEKRLKSALSSRIPEDNARIQALFG